MPASPLVLLTGAGGQLALEIKRLMPPNVRLIALGRGELNITDRSTVKARLQHEQPDVVINGAAYTAVDAAEANREIAYAVNRDGAANLAIACAHTHARLIHISTDFVFDGKKGTPYVPDDRPNPLSVYGASKWAGEQAVMETNAAHSLIIRTAWVYSMHGRNFLKTMLRLMTEREELNVVADQHGTPTSTAVLAQAVWDTAFEPQYTGIHHWTNGGSTTWHGFAEIIQKKAIELGLLDKVIPIHPVGTEDYQTPAVRPKYSVLADPELSQSLGYAPPPWQQSLAELLRRYAYRRS